LYRGKHYAKLYVQIEETVMTKRIFRIRMSPSKFPHPFITIQIKILKMKMNFHENKIRTSKKLIFLYFTAPASNLNPVYQFFKKKSLCLHRDEARKRDE
jgi:hypothetical protein